MNQLEYLVSYRPNLRLLPWVAAGTLMLLGAALYPWRARRHGGRELRFAAVPVAIVHYLVALAYSGDESAIQSGWKRAVGRVAVTVVVFGIGVLAGT